MFDLERAIADWRMQMLAAGIKAPVPLEELESHLREDLAARMLSGATAEQALETAVRHIGGGELLQPEFARAGDAIFEQMKRLFCAFAGIPTYQPAMNMNIPNSSLEPRWATYLKSAAWIFPAVFVWIACCVFVVPKLKELGYASQMELPNLISFQLAVADAIRMNFLLGSLIILIALVLVEWRWHGWSRYRRLLFGIAGFCLNFSALCFLASLLVYAVLVASHLAHPQSLKP
jgi:hypothetical protein